MLQHIELKLFPLPHEMPKVYCVKIWFGYVSIWSHDDDDIHSTDLPDDAPCMFYNVKKGTDRLTD